MDMIPVVSTNVKRIGWKANFKRDSESQPRNILRVEFKSGFIYDYLDVPDFVHRELMKADSKGSYINRKIINRYTCLTVNRNNNVSR